MLISEKHKLADIIPHDFRLIPIIARFDIPFGFGDKTIHQICEEKNINLYFFLEIINAFHDQNYKPDKQLQKFSLTVTVDYLLKSHRYYKAEKIPYINHLIEKLIWTKPEHVKNKSLITKFFTQYKNEVETHTKFEEKIIYPYVLEVEQAMLTNSISDEFKHKLSNSPVAKYKGEHEELNAALFDLKNIIIKYLPPADNSEITIRILTEIFRLEEDMKDHTHIEDKVLIPKVQNIENELLNRL